MQLMYLTVLESLPSRVGLHTDKPCVVVPSR